MNKMNSPKDYLRRVLPYFFLAILIAMGLIMIIATGGGGGGGDTPVPPATDDEGDDDDAGDGEEVQDTEDDAAGDNDTGNTETDDGSDSGSGLTSCGSTNAIYTTAPLASSAYTSITPLGNLNPPGHTFPTVHTYMMLTDTNVAVPVYAPGDITITQISSSTTSSSYSVTFYPCSELKGYFNHMTTLSDNILNQLSDSDICDWTSIPENTIPYCINIEVSSGTIIGYIGGPSSDGSAALDFGARDTRIVPIQYINTERSGTDKQYVVCAYDYYADGTVHDTLTAKLREARTTDPICGTVDLDMANAAQGLWYLSGSSTDSSEDEHVALVPSNFDPSVGVLSIGNSDVGTDAYYFDMESSGLVRRNFAEVSNDGNRYCYDNLRNRTASLDTGNSTPLSGYLFLEMPTHTTLTLERSSTGSCPSDPNTLSFSGNAVEFSR